MQVGIYRYFKISDKDGQTMSSFPCTGSSILEFNYASFAGYYMLYTALPSRSNYQN
jgi:hypothetical protein